MGNLHGSEFWTYLLPRCCGEANARKIMAERLPMGATQAKALGLADDVVPGRGDIFVAGVMARARQLVGSGMFAQLIAAKQATRARDEAQKPLSTWRAEELVGMRRSFYGADPSYHVARNNFVRKVPKARTPLTIAGHRSLRNRHMRSGTQ
jgi:putative two-component system hydrogenase maturation factor HypX/HoxX